MAYQIRVVAGPDEGTAYQLPPTGIQGIGRSHAHCDLVLHDLTLDRVHCELVLDEDSAQVQDNDSSSGTFVNGERITKKPLQNGDLIRIGGSELCFELIQEVKAAPPPMPQAIPTVAAVDLLAPLKARAGPV